jgi:hypothetical protein
VGRVPIVDEWRDQLRHNAGGYAQVALANIAREYPYDARHLWRGADDRPPRPRERNPVFYGSFDWHSCVEMHWLLVRLLRVALDAVPADEIRQALDAQLSEAGLAAEARYMADPDTRNGQRPYGWGWALRLAAELATWDDPDSQAWSARFGPLADQLRSNFIEWLPRADYPGRYGVHSNTAFGLSLALPFARSRATTGDTELLAGMIAAAQRWYGRDIDYPAGWEPSGSDFLSPALVEAELMAQLLPPDEFPAWLSRFLPGIAGADPASLFSPVLVSDATDGQIAHLHGLNMSRAFCWRRIAESLPEGDPRIDVARQAMRHHAEAALPHVVGDDYMVEHWLAAYAVLLLS